MSMPIGSQVVREIRHEIGALRGNWLWFVLLGVALIVLGAVALGSAVIASLAAAIVLGAMILVSGVFEIVGAFWCRAWSGFLLHLLFGALGVVVGLLFLMAPANALLALTLLLAAMLMVQGVFEIVAALLYQFAFWGWALVGGIIDLLLGIVIWQGWPGSSFVVLGVVLGVSLIFRGVSWVMLGLGLKALLNRLAA